MNDDEIMKEALARAVAKVNFDAGNALTPQARVMQLETCIHEAIDRMRQGQWQWWCHECNSMEFLDPAHNNPMHRHEGALIMLRRVPRVGTM